MPVQQPPPPPPVPELPSWLFIPPWEMPDEKGQPLGLKEMKDQLKYEIDDTTGEFVKDPVTGHKINIKKKEKEEKKKAKEAKEEKKKEKEKVE